MLMTLVSTSARRTPIWVELKRIGAVFFSCISPSASERAQVTDPARGAVSHHNTATEQMLLRVALRAGSLIALWVEDDFGPSVIAGIEVLIAGRSLVE